MSRTEIVQLAVQQGFANTAEAHFNGLVDALDQQSKSSIVMGKHLDEIRSSQLWKYMPPTEDGPFVSFNDFCLYVCGFSGNQGARYIRIWRAFGGLHLDSGQLPSLSKLELIARQIAPGATKPVLKSWVQFAMVNSLAEVHHAVNEELRVFDPSLPARRGRHESFGFACTPVQKQKASALVTLVQSGVNDDKLPGVPTGQTLTVGDAILFLATQGAKNLKLRKPPSKRARRPR